MQEGRIVEQGTHSELLAAGGAYSALVRRQLLFGQPAEGAEAAEQAVGGSEDATSVSVL